MDAVQLLAADDADLEALRRVLLDLPADAYGQAIVESTTPIPVDLERPAGISLTWLHRDPFAPAPLAAGTLAARAVGAWAAEWMPGADDLQPAMVWLGISVRASVTTLLQEHGCSCHDTDPHGPTSGRWPQER